MLKRKAEEGVKIYVVVYKEVAATMSMGSQHTKVRIVYRRFYGGRFSLLFRMLSKLYILILPVCVTPTTSVAKVCYGLIFKGSAV